MTIIFVHGISVRAAGYEVAFRYIEAMLKSRRPDVKLAPCLWGDSFGAVLKAGGISIPWFSQTKGIDEELGQVDEDVARWQCLVIDPLAELRLWALRPAVVEPFDPRGRKTSSQILDARIQNLVPSAQLAEILSRASIRAKEFDRACQMIVRSSIYNEALDASAGDLNSFRFTLARAIVAQAMIQGQAAPGPPPILFDAPLRDVLVAQLAAELGNEQKGLVGDWGKQAIRAFGTRYLLAWRGHYTEVVVPFVGDILLYQGHGQPIRECIRSAVEQAEPPIVLLGHSLGGIACVDLLVEQHLERVELLVTIGSQSPLFFEMDALQSLRFGQPLPDHFPRWLNLYDRRDFLSYVGAQVFPDPRDRLEDFEVNNRQSFPQSHGAYWANPQTWDIILPRLPNAS
jgi:hypothetical protein